MFRQLHCILVLPLFQQVMQHVTTPIYLIMIKHRLRMEFLPCQLDSAIVSNGDLLIAHLSLNLGRFRFLRTMLIPQILILSKGLLQDYPVHLSSRQEWNAMFTVPWPVLS